MSREACHFPIYTENVKMSVPPAASGGDISQSKTAQIPLLLAAKQMKMQQSSSCPILVKMMCFSLFLVAVICLHACVFISLCLCFLCTVFRLQCLMIISDAFVSDNCISMYESDSRDYNLIIWHLTKTRTKIRMNRFTLKFAVIFKKRLCQSICQRETV